jgi:low affinity Fe/Cu permease
MYQGINFFNAGYDYELIKAGFSRNISNTISNVTVLPISILACILSPQIQKYGVVNSLRINMFFTILLAAYLLIFFPLDVWNVSIASFLGDFLGTW